MEAKDLMIGDWVQIVPDAPVMPNEYHRIDWIRTGEIGLDNRKIVTYPYIQPIPLTPEILEKNGWSHSQLHGSYGRKGMRIDGPPYEELPDGIKNPLDFAQWSIDEEFQYHLLEIYMWRGNIRLWVNYVHELQRALRCCELNELANNFKV